MSASDFTFNLQSFLRDMREEQQAALAVLSSKVEEGFGHASDAFRNHELSDTQRFGSIDGRLKGLEDAQKTVRWTSRTVIGGFLLYALNMILAHTWK